MRRITLGFLFAISLLVLLSCRANAPTTEAADAIAKVEQGLFAGAPVVGRPGETLEKRMTELDVPAVSIAVIQDFEVLWARAYGVADRSTGQEADTETLFQAASISKPVTALAVHRLVEAGQLSLDVPINDYLSSWTLPENELTQATPVTLRMLLSHTGGTTVHGFPGYEPGSPLPSLQQVLDGEAPANTPPIRVDIPPGERFRYSGGGTTIVQQALIDAVGKPFPDLMRELVLEPIGMVDSGFDQPLPAERAASAAKAHQGDAEHGGPSHVYPELAAAGLWTTPSDLARFAVEIQHALRGDQDALIAQETAEQMLTPVVDNVTPGLFHESRHGGAYLEHGGGNRGFRCQLVFHRDQGYGAAVMTNGFQGDVVADEVLNAIALAYQWEGYLPEPIHPIELGPDELGTYTGRYRAGPDRVVVLTAADGVLLHREVLGRRTLRLYPVAPDTFRYSEQAEPVTFFRGPHGRITRIEAAGLDLRWERLADDELLPPELLLEGRIDEGVAAYRALEGIDERRLNQVGYQLLAEPANLDAAIAIFRLNTELYPHSANTWDSLGEGYMVAGETELAISNYEKSLELDPTNTNAEKMLERLRVR
jgi:CubicO group peptidase (beta-lactamase class C family)